MPGKIRSVVAGFLLIGILCCAMPQVPIYGTEGDSVIAQEIYSNIKKPLSDLLLYSKDKIADEGNAAISTVLDLDAAVFETNESFSQWKISIPEEGAYQIQLMYCSISDKIGDFEIRFLVNGELQYASANGIKMMRRYIDKTKIRQDKRGNDIRPEKQEEKVWLYQDLKDARGIYNDPLLFSFKKGENIIRIESIKAGFAIHQIKIYNPADLQSYDEYNANNEGKANQADSAYEQIQAESPVAVSSTVLYPTYDKSNAATSPSDPVKLRLNTIGQSNWKMSGQWIEWEIDAPQSGIYSIGMRVRQNYIRGYYSSRTIFIDGKQQFKEMKSMRFPYNISWYIKYLGEVNPYRFYFTKGKHIIRMEVVPGVAGEVLSKFNSIILDLNTSYRKMIMITGVTPDQYRDYQLQKDIPGLLLEFKEKVAQLRQLKIQIAQLGITSGSDAVVIEKLASQIESFVEKPDTIPLRLEDFRNNISSVSSWLLSLKEQPLEIDYLFIKGENVKAPTENALFFEQFAYRMKALLGSFFNDYSMIGDSINEEEKSLKIWINLGRDQAQIIKDLSENYFVRDTNVPVNISLVQQGLTEAIAAGKGPDISLYTGAGDSVNFAARGALTDLSQYENFGEIQSRFETSSMTPFRYQGGVYGVPLQQSFNMMFYRKDIFDELKITPPQTWSEFYNVLTIIQKNKLLVGIPVGTAIAPDNSIFDMLLFQNGGQYYNSEFSKTELDKENALKAFKQWTEFYKKYSLPISYDFYNRFRSGEMPLGIAGYSIYNMLSVAAPEIEGLWAMVPVPGTLREDGSLNKTTTGGVTGLVMMKGIKNKAAGFRYIDWFTSKKTQIEYGLAIENIFGQAGRYDTANIEALKEMNWSQKELSVLLSQLNNLELAAQVPASYYITRSITNAFRSVVISSKNPRESLYTYNSDMNAELERKRKELKIG